MTFFDFIYSFVGQDDRYYVFFLLLSAGFGLVVFDGIIRFIFGSISALFYKGR